MSNFRGMALGGSFTHLRGFFITVRTTEHLRKVAADFAGNDEPGVMEPGHCFTIEPALVQGSRSRGHMWEDGWTIATDVGPACY